MGECKFTKYPRASATKSQSSKHSGVPESCLCKMELIARRTSAPNRFFLFTAGFSDFCCASCQDPNALVGRSRACLEKACPVGRSFCRDARQPNGARGPSVCEAPRPSDEDVVAWPQPTDRALSYNLNSGLPWP